MENHSGHLEHPGMADQGFRPFTSLLLSTPAMAQQHASSLVNTASIQMPIPPSHPDSGSICLTDDGYIWRKLGRQEISECGSPIINYECAQANCRVKKSVVLSSDGQIFETVLRGSHNHPRASERWPGDGPAGLEPGNQDFLLPAVSAAGPSMPRSIEGGEQLPSSSDSEEDDDDEGRAKGDFAGDASATERQVPAPGERITAQTKTRNSNRNERRKSMSKVWDEFTALKRAGKIQGAECKHCKKCLSGKSTGGTSHLRRHLKICPERLATGRLQEQQSSPRPDSSVEKNRKFDQDKSLELLAKALVSNLCSFSLTSSSNFREFMAGICPTYDMASQGAIREKFLRIFQDEKLILKEKIALLPGGVFLAITKWSIDFAEFICVTMNFIDKEWKMNRKIIRCSYFGNDDITGRHHLSLFPDWPSYCRWDMEAAKGIIKEVAQDWSLEKKLLGISWDRTLDDADILDLQENLTAQNYLLAKYKLLTLPCIVDALHGLFGCEINNHVLQTKENWFKYMTCSPLRREKYKEVLSQLPLNQPSFGSKNWLWVYYFLEAALLFNKVLPNPGQMDAQTYPSKPSLNAVENFCFVVRPIYNAIKVVSNHRYATLNSHFHVIWSLKVALMGSSKRANIDQVFNVGEMQKKFDKLWRKWYLWLSLGVVLDPRCKIGFLNLCFKQAFGSDAKRYICEVRGKMYELFLQYSCCIGQRSCEHLNQRNNDLQLDTQGNLPVHDTSKNYIEQSAYEEFGELSAYLEGDPIPQNVPLDILKWWKDNALMYPTLAMLARDILSIPGSAVSAESAFDETDERVSLFHRKMSPEVVEALICTQDWIKSSEISDENGRNRTMLA